MATMAPATYLTTQCCSLCIQVNAGQAEEKGKTAKSKTVEAVRRPQHIPFLSETSLTVLLNFMSSLLTSQLSTLCIHIPSI